VPPDPDTIVTRIAVARAMTGDLVGEASRAGADVYLTGELRPTARPAVLATGIAAVTVGHARAERWSLGLLGHLLAAEWPDLRIDLAPEGTAHTR
jgi:putative NIF3 family GTP cyclohydrolase 1 type 2